MKIIGTKEEILDLDDAIEKARHECLSDCETCIVGGKQNCSIFENPRIENEYID